MLMYSVGYCVILNSITIELLKIGVIFIAIIHENKLFRNYHI